MIDRIRDWKLMKENRSVEQGLYKNGGLYITHFFPFECEIGRGGEHERHFASGLVEERQIISKDSVPNQVAVQRLNQSECYELQASRRNSERLICQCRNAQLADPGRQTRRSCASDH
jgi:hypothetical protein